MAMVCNTQLESLCRDPAAVRVRLNEFMGSLAAAFLCVCVSSIVKSFQVEPCTRFDAVTWSDGEVGDEGPDSRHSTRTWLTANGEAVS